MMRNNTLKVSDMSIHKKMSRKSTINLTNIELT